MADKPLLIAYDGSEPAQHAIARAAELHPGRDAIVLTVWQRAPSQAGYGSRLAGYREAARVLDKSAADWARRTSRKGADMARKAGLEARPMVAKTSADNVAKAIIDVSVNEGADLIVLGSRGRSKVISWLLGSTANSVAQQCGCPVLIVK
jgi:nucleotide-binding universal stress UspA family protein